MTKSKSQKPNPMQSLKVHHYEAIDERDEVDHHHEVSTRSDATATSKDHTTLETDLGIVKDSLLKRPSGRFSKRTRSARKAKSRNLMDEDVSFELERLFDPYNFDHIPEDKRLDLFAKRDLKFTKQYKACVKILGARPLRIRTLIPPPMDTMAKRRCGQYIEQTPLPPEPLSTSALNPKSFSCVPEISRPSEDTTNNNLGYRDWIEERKKAREDLNNIGLNYNYLARKKDKTALEKRVMRQIEPRYAGESISSLEIQKPTSSQELRKRASLPPVVNLPNPYAIKALEDHLRIKRLRLVDLFKDFDKSGKWRLTHDEFRNSIKRAAIPLSDKAIEDLILILDTDFNNEIDFKELYRGVQACRMERIHQRHQSSNDSLPLLEKSSQSMYPERMGQKDEEGGERPMTATSQQTVLNISPTDSPIYRGTPPRTGLSDPEGFAGELFCTKSLELPTSDHRPERFIFDSNEAMLDMRKRMMGTEAAMKRSKTARHPVVVPAIIKIGDDRIDAHCQHSTLTSEKIVDLLHSFRAERLKEFYDVIELCKEKQVVLSKLLLKKALLYPGDRTYQEINGHIRQPGLSLLSSDFFKKSQKSDDNSEWDDASDKRKRNYGRIPMVYPFRRLARAKKERQNLSTGKTNVSRKIDCWMTYEEYERLTGTAAVRYLEFDNDPAYNPFWPGHMLDLLVLCMPPYDYKPHPQKGSKVLFQEIPPWKTSVNSQHQKYTGAWPVGEDGVVQQGHLHMSEIQNYSI